MIPSCSQPPPEGGATQYDLRLIQTRDATGYFMPVPQAMPDLVAVLAHLESHPYDEFMHRYGLQLVMDLPLEEVRALMARASADAILMPLLLEACLLHQPLRALLAEIPAGAVAAFRHDTPLIILRSACLPDQERHREWIAFLKSNLLHHQPLPEPPDPLPAPHGDTSPLPAAGLSDLPVPTGIPGSPEPVPAFEVVAARALECLDALGILEDGERRHENSLSPIALLRRWRLDVRVEQDRHNFEIRGLQTAYGKGLSLERARASCLMEIVERVSAFASVVGGRLPDTARKHALVKGRLSELQRDGIPALDPNTLSLEVPYEDQSLYWLPGEPSGHDRDTPLMVPFQAAALFANLDEIGLFSGLGSTGLAAGWSPDQAKFHGILECIERDAEAVMLFDPARCFRLAARDEAVARLLAAYRHRGIDVIFQDIGDTFGIPCYRCFVHGPRPGEIAKGTSAHFCGWKAALSALTETPYPFPHGPPSRPGPHDLPLLYIEDLPDLASDDVKTDLDRLQRLLATRGFHPVYVDLTRRDIAIPVVRALVPGLELIADYDRYARVNPRLFHNYQRWAAAQPRRA